MKDSEETDLNLICAECCDEFPKLIGWKYDSDWRVCENCYEMLENEED
jgi:hypothetical protein